jgi:hypothetical protein
MTPPTDPYTSAEPDAPATSSVPEQPMSYWVRRKRAETVAQHSE